jgi:hypothetical protein
MSGFKIVVDVHGVSDFSKPTEVIASVNGNALPSRMGTSGEVKVMIASDTPRPKSAARRCSGVRTLKPFLSMSVALAWGTA